VDEVKKKIILKMGMLFFIGASLTACTESSLNEGAFIPEPVSAKTPAPAETDVTAEEPIVEVPEHFEILPIVVAWASVQTTFDDDETPQLINEFADFPPIVEIRADNIIFGMFWTTLFEGTVIQTGLHEYKITNQSAGNEGGQWNPEDAFLIYDSASGLLRWTLFITNPYARNESVHHFFTRE
jgi:hypothetical protein